MQAREFSGGEGQDMTSGRGWGRAGGGRVVQVGRKGANNKATGHEQGLSDAHAHIYTPVCEEHSRA